jgi:hypothetical protein
MNRERTTSTTPATAASDAVAADGPARSLWFDPPSDDQDRRRQLTRERVVEEALTVIAQDGVEALTMRGLGARLGQGGDLLQRHRHRSHHHDHHGRAHHHGGAHHHH